jgi:hypothetical protein
MDHTYYLDQYVLEFQIQTYRNQKIIFLSSNSLHFKPFSKISSALSPLTVTKTEIFSFLFIPNDLIVYLAFPQHGVYPVKSSITL